MRGDQFSLHRRGGFWHVQFNNPHTHRYLTARSTGESNRNAALLKVAAWIRDGLPDPSGGSRRLRELLDLDLAISIIRSAPLTPDDAGRIVQALKDRDLIGDATVGAGPVSASESAAAIAAKQATGSNTKALSEIRKSDLNTFSLWLKRPHGKYRKQCPFRQGQSPSAGRQETMLYKTTQRRDS